MAIFSFVYASELRKARKTHETLSKPKKGSGGEDRREVRWTLGEITWEHPTASTADTTRRQYCGVGRKDQGWCAGCAKSYQCDRARLLLLQELTAFPCSMVKGLVYLVI